MKGWALSGKQQGLVRHLPKVMGADLCSAKTTLAGPGWEGMRRGPEGHQGRPEVLVA